METPQFRSTSPFDFSVLLSPPSGPLNMSELDGRLLGLIQKPTTTTTNSHITCRSTDHSTPPSPIDFQELTGLATPARPASVSSVSRSSPNSVESRSSDEHYHARSPSCLSDIEDRSTDHAFSMDLRASPFPGEDLTEEQRTKYALDIWYARYNGIWFPSIFPPTYINLPNAILNEICSKAVDQDVVTFASFSDLMENPDEIRKTYQRTENLLSIPVAVSSPLTPLNNPPSAEGDYCRPAFWQSDRDIINPSSDDGLDVECRSHDEVESDVSCNSNRQ